MEVTTELGALVTAVCTGIAALVTAWRANKTSHEATQTSHQADGRSKKAEELVETIRNQMYLEIARHTEFLDALEHSGNFLRSTNKQRLQECLGMLLAESDFIMKQIAQHTIMNERIHNETDPSFQRLEKQFREVETKLFEELTDVKIRLSRRHPEDLKDAVRRSIIPVSKRLSEGTSDETEGEGL